MPPYEHEVLANDSQHSNDITIENLRSSNDFSGTKEKYEVEPSVMEVVKSEEVSEGDFPDGGLRAWLIVVGVCYVQHLLNVGVNFEKRKNYFWVQIGHLILILSIFGSITSSGGYVNSWGIFQNFYQETILKDSAPSSIAWIGSIQYSLIFLPGLLVGRLFDLGYFRSVFLTSSVTLVLATFLVAECSQYWHFLLCQGIVVGLGCGGIFGPTTAIIAHWFKNRRGLAIGFVAMGSSIGGTVLPIAARNLLPRVGFKWTMRIFGFILLIILGASNLLLKRRLPPRKVAGGLLNLAAFKSAPYSIYCGSAFVNFLGIYTVLTYVGVSATSIGISSEFSFYFISLANASSLFGRYAAGNICDRIGAMNVMIPFTAAAGILTYAWPFAQSKLSLIAITILYGFVSGAYVSLSSNPMMEMGHTGDVGRRIGMLNSILALGALAGPPISGAIETATGGFRAVGYYAGTSVLVGVGLMCVSRHLILRRMFGKI